MTVLVPPDSKQETELQNKSSQTVCKNKRNFRGRGQGIRPSRQSSSTLPPVSATEYAKTDVFYSEQEEIRTGPSIGHPVPMCSVTPVSGKSLPTRFQGSRGYSTSV